jgi:23S rRNA (cytidine1920-2'-O)/16S rRNA (cytidine1409-2'-O)-methyltransferase
MAPAPDSEVRRSGEWRRVSHDGRAAMAERDCPYVSRSGLKLAAAVRTFALDAAGQVCCDFGSHTGGFVDCLLQHGAARVYAVDPGYGVLAYRLRSDPRVVVCERTNALRFTCPELCDVVTIDVGWTPQRLILPVAHRCLKRDVGRVVTLIKPHYEAPQPWLRGGVLPPERLSEVLATCRGDARQGGWQILAEMESPLRGHGGNVEYLWLLSR